MHISQSLMNTFLLLHFLHWLFKNLCFLLRRKRKTSLGTKSWRIPKARQIYKQKSLIFQHLLLKFLHLYLRGVGNQTGRKLHLHYFLSWDLHTYLMSFPSYSFSLKSSEKHAHTRKRRRCTDHWTYRFINTETTPRQRRQAILWYSKQMTVTVRNGLLLKPAWTLNAPIPTQFLFIQEL